MTPPLQAGIYGIYIMKGLVVPLLKKRHLMISALGWRRPGKKDGFVSQFTSGMGGLTISLIRLVLKLPSFLESWFSDIARYSVDEVDVGRQRYIF